MSISDETTVDEARELAGVAPKTGRSRDAAASKESLLQAAEELFGQRGFERTTIRDIGELAGVDAALIARYFGSKADLYVAAVAAEDASELYPGGFEGLEQMADTVVSRADDHGPGPIMQALIRLDGSDDIRRAALQRVKRRLVDPLVVDMTARGVTVPTCGADRDGGHVGYQPLPIARVVRGGPIWTQRRARRPHGRGPPRGHRGPGPDRASLATALTIGEQPSRKWPFPSRAVTARLHFRKGRRNPLQRVG